jgi:hypothetical protein
MTLKSQTPDLTITHSVDINQNGVVDQDEFAAAEL